MNKRVSPHPLFVIGNPRSGTTLLRLALTSHSLISIPPESSFIIYLFPKYGYVKKFTKDALTNFEKDLRNPRISPVNRWKMTEADFQRAIDNMTGKNYAEACQEIYKCYPKPGNDAGVAYWGDKNTAFYKHIETLSHLYPNAKFIHIIRDVRAVFASYKSLAQKIKEGKSEFYPNLPSGPLETAVRWKNAVETTEKEISRLEGQNISIRYEDLVTNPELELKRICKLLSIPFEEKMLSFYKLNKKFQLEPTEHDDWKWRTKEPISTGRISAWKSKLTLEEVEAIEQVCGNTLRNFSYETGPALKTNFSAFWNGIPVRFDIFIKSIGRKLRFLFVKIK